MTDERSDSGGGALFEVQQADQRYGCRTCRAAKPGSEFHWRRGLRDVLCKECRRAKAREQYKNSNGRGKDQVLDRSLRRRFGISIVQYKAMVEDQRHRCAICGEVPQTVNRLHVDHDHVTGRIRALLCHHCNVLLANARDSIPRLQQAIAYLEHHAARADDAA